MSELLYDLLEYGEVRLWKCDRYYGELHLEIPADGVELIAHESDSLAGVLMRIKMQLSGLANASQDCRSLGNSSIEPARYAEQ